MNIFILLFSLLASPTYAQEAASEPPKKFKGESEASTVVVSGNTNSETYGAKTKNTFYLSELVAASVFGKLLKTQTSGVETANSWEFGARLERTFTKDVLSAFMQHKAEHDPYNGVFIQRDSTDLGLKYIIETTDTLNWLTEAGLRSSKLYTGPINETLIFARLFSEVVYKLSPTSRVKFWAELLPNITRPDEYQYNSELSLSVTITTMFSLKSALLLNHNHAVLDPKKKDTTTWTTSLLATY